MKHLIPWIMIIVVLFLTCNVIKAMRSHNMDICLTRISNWESAARQEKAVIGSYQETMNIASYVISQHIYMLDGIRQDNPDFLKKYSYSLSNLERSTPTLKKKYEAAKDAASKIRFPIYLDY